MLTTRLLDISLGLPSSQRVPHVYVLRDVCFPVSLIRSGSSSMISIWWGSITKKSIVVVDPIELAEHRTLCSPLTIIATPTLTYKELSTKPTHLRKREQSQQLYPSNRYIVASYQFWQTRHLSEILPQSSAKMLNLKIDAALHKVIKIRETMRWSRRSQNRIQRPDRDFAK
jgi:hypothetical protein